MSRSFVIAVFGILVSCGSIDDSEERNSEIRTSELSRSNDTIPIEKESKIVFNPDSCVGYNDAFYSEFSDSTTCRECWKFINNENPKIALVAYLKLCFGDCSTSTDSVLSILKKFEQRTDTVCLMSSIDMYGIKSISEAAAAVILNNELYPFSEEEKRYVEDLYFGR